MKPVYLILTVSLCGILLSAAWDLPNWADPHSPASEHLSPYYITHALQDTEIPNFVTAVLADYRGFDTMFETAVVLTAGIALVLLLRPWPGQPKRLQIDESVTQDTDQVVQATCRLVVPPMQLFALYVVAHGHHSPGGGFQGGVILGASFILYALSYGSPAARERFLHHRKVVFATLGLLLYAGTGLLCILLGGNFLEYGVLVKVLPLDSQAAAHSFGVLIVEIGVALTVTSVMFLCYLYLSTHGECDPGL